MEWLKENRPGSQMISVNAFGSVNLYSAVKGQFRYDGNKFTFVYDIANGTMYTDERFEEACTSIRDAAAVRLGLDPDKTVMYSFGMSFLPVSENDAPAQWATPAGELIQTQAEKILPADADPEMFAEIVMSGEQEFVYHLDYYDNDFPIFDPQMLELCPSLSKVALHREITPGMTGVYSRTYAKDGIWQEYCHIEKLEDGLYGGWICSHEPEEDSLVFTRTGRKSFTVQIPAHTELVLLSEKEVRFIHTFSVTVANICPLFFGWITFTSPACFKFFKMAEYVFFDISKISRRLSLLTDTTRVFQSIIDANTSKRSFAL